MKKLYLTVASLLLMYLLHIPATGIAQTDACNHGLTLSSQAEVDNWPVTHGCSGLIGQLIISGNDITNLDSLYSLTYVNSDLVIRDNDVLVNLDGLSNLGSALNVTIKNNASLTNVDGLHSMTYIWDSLKIISNPQLQDLDGLSSLKDGQLQNVEVTDNALIQNVEFLSSFTGIEGVVISGNPSFTSLDGLRNVTVIYQVLDINNNASLTNLGGLNNITHIYRSLRISSNASLTDINALSNLTRINEDQEAYLTIENNPILPNLDGLSSLTRVSGYNRSGVTINNNAMLSNVDGLTNLTNIGGSRSYLTVTNNPNLGMCCGLYEVVWNHSWQVGACEETHICSTITISGNKPSCTETEILNNCIPDEEKCSGEIRLITQEAVDNFPSSRGCTVITGSLFISGPLITNLDGLSALTQAEDVTITNNYMLESFTLENLARVKNLTIDGSYSLHSANLPALTTVDENLDMRLNAANLDGFSSLSSVGDNLHISYSAAKNMYGLESLTAVGGSLIIDHNAQLSNLDGLDNLKSIGGKLDLNNNDKLLNVDALLGLDSVGNEGGISVSVTKNRVLEWCCGLGRVLQDHLYSGSVNISENSAGCQQSYIEANGPCCQPGSPLPADKFVFAEVPRGYAPLSTNIIVRDYEPGIYYELRTDADNGMVAGPQPGDVGLYAANIMQTTTFNVLARNPATGCRNMMSTKPTVTILSQPDSTDCSSLPSLDKQLVAENDTVPPGGATNIIVLNYDEGVEYLLRNDVDNSDVAGPWPGDVGLYTGALDETTVFNVLAIHTETGCTQQMTQKVTVAVEGGAMMANVYPNPANGEFTVEVPGETDTYYLSVSDYFGKVITKETVQGGTGVGKRIDLRPAREGIYFLTIYGSKGETVTRKLVVRE